MSKSYALKAMKRDAAGKGAARALRREHKTPAVIYGGNDAPMGIALEQNTINVEYRKGRMYVAVCELDVDGKNHMVLARDVQLHPVTDNVEHVDFLRVTPKTRIEVDVPVHFINHEESPGLKEKGILNVALYNVKLSCMALEIPDYIEVDLAGKEMGAYLHISDAILPPGVKPVDSRDFVMAHIVEPKKIEDEPVAAAAAPAAEGAAAAAPAAGTKPAAGAKPAEAAKPAGDKKK